MHALISGSSVVQVQGQTFTVAPPLFWIVCGGQVTTQYLYDFETETFFLPDPPEVDRIEEIKAELRAIDMASIRPTRAINKTGNGVSADIEMLDDLDAQAVILRAELAGLL